MEENHGTIEENHRTIEENHGKIEENHGKIEENHGKIEWKSWNNPMKTMENSIKPWNKNPETSGKIDEQCEWEILAAKTKEGSLDDKKKCKKKCQFNFAPQELSVLNDVVNHHEPAIGDVSHSAEPISAEIGNPQILPMVTVSPNIP